MQGELRVAALGEHVRREPGAQAVEPPGVGVDRVGEDPQHLEALLQGQILLLQGQGARGAVDQVGRAVGRDPLHQEGQSHRQGLTPLGLGPGRVHAAHAPQAVLRVVLERDQGGDLAFGRGHGPIAAVGLDLAAQAREVQEQGV